MKNLFATFSEWYIGDGIYPPLYKNQQVNLSFYVQADEAVLSTKKSSLFEQRKHADYHFSGEVVYVYTDKNEQLILLEADDFRFFIHAFQPLSEPSIGDFIEGTGQLFVDDFSWAETYHQYPNLPSPFYNLEIQTLLKVMLPAHHIRQNPFGRSYPASLCASEYTDNDITVVKDMDDEKEETVFYLLDMLFINEKTEQTFIS